MEAPLSAKAALLQALVIPGYGLELAERIRRDSSGRVRLRLGSIYPALRALEEQGLVRSRLVPRPRGAGRPRRFYHLTPRGVAASLAQRDALAAFFRPVRARPSAEEVKLMAARIRQCIELSAFVLELRRQVLSAAGRSRR
jgi:PadR family transcriptional regulator, regulatory protein PadR